MANYNPTHSGTTAVNLVNDKLTAESVMHNMLLGNGYTRHSDDTHLFVKGNKKFRVHPPTSGTQGVVHMVSCASTALGTEQLLATFPITEDQMNNLQSLL